MTRWHLFVRLLPIFFLRPVFCLFCGYSSASLYQPFFFFTHFCLAVSGHAVVTGVVPSPPWFLHLVLIAQKVQKSLCSSRFHRVLLSRSRAFRKSICAREKVPIFFFFFNFFFIAHFHFPASGQAVVTGVIPSPPRFLPSIFYRA